MANQVKWLIDPAHSEIAFKVRHLMIAYVKGSFKTFDANISTTDKEFTTAEIDLWIDTYSVTTADEVRDDHLKGPDFFDCMNHRRITFTSNTIGKPGKDGNHELLGELTMKGVTKKVKFDVQFGGIVTDPWGNEKAGFTLNGKIKRSDWGLVWNATIESGGLVVSDEVVISCEIELINTSKRELAQAELSAAGKNGTL